MPAFSFSRPQRRFFAQAAPYAFWGAAAALVGAILVVSWMKWMDPVIDFGREVYVPWRILGGERPVQDYVHLYGPFSAYFNAGLFFLFGVSIQTEVIANLAIFAGIVVCLFTLLRRSFGYYPAAVATLTVIATFGFGHYYGINNYTYAAPYSHEATHGMLFLLLLLVWLGRARSFAADSAAAWVAGILIALNCLTKTEYVAASVALWAANSYRLMRTKALRPKLGGWLRGTMAGFGLTFLGAWLLLSLAVTPGMAIKSVINAIAAPLLYGSLSRTPLGLKLIGLDDFWGNLGAILSAGGSAAAVLAVMAIVGRATCARGVRWLMHLFVAMVVVVAGFAVFCVQWLEVGVVFPVLLAAAMLWLLHQRRASSLRSWRRDVFLVAAAVMLLRMAFNPVISQYGFFQAILAGAWLCGFLVGEWPGIVAPVRQVRRGVVAAVTLLFLGMSATLLGHSYSFYKLKRLPVGSGADRIFAYGPETHKLPEMWERARQYITANSRGSATVFAIPEGVSLNYWTRSKHPLPITDVLPATLRLTQDDLLQRLAANPPDFVVVFSRPMKEFGYRAYGEDDASGKRILDWVAQNYGAEFREVGLFEPGKVGLVVLRRAAP